MGFFYTETSKNGGNNGEPPFEQFKVYYQKKLKEFVCTCDYCDGSGQIPGDKMCMDCDGHGYLTEARLIQLVDKLGQNIVESPSVNLRNFLRRKREMLGDYVLRALRKVKEETRLSKKSKEKLKKSYKKK